MAGFLQESDGAFSLRRLLAFFAFIICVGGAIALGIVGVVNDSMVAAYVAGALLAFALVLILVLLGFTTMADIKAIAQAVKKDE